MRIPSGKTDQSIYFVALDATDMVTRKTGLSSFSVRRSRNAGTDTAYTTPTVVEISSANQPGVYALLIDEDTTIASTSDSEEYCVHITATGMAPVDRTIELYRRDTTTGTTVLVDSNGRLDVTKVAGTSQTARDLGASVLLAADQAVNVTKWAGTATTLTGGLPDVNTKTINDGIIAAATFAANALDAVWATATRVLTAGTNIALAKGTGVTGLNDLDASGLRAAVGLASANLDTQLDALPTNTELTAALAGADDAVLAAITALNNLSAAQVRTELTVELARIDAAISSCSTYAGGDTSGTTTLLSRVTSTRAGLFDNLDAAMTTRASQTSVDDVPTNAELTTALASADDATLAAISGLSIPTVVQIRTEMDSNSIKLASIDNKTINLPSDPADESLIIAAIDAIFNRIGAPVGASISDDISNISTGGGGLDAAGIRDAIGLASPDLDTQLDVINSKADDIKNVTDGLPTFVHTGGKVWSLDSDGNPLNNISAVDVRTELAVELALIDAAISSRFADASYTAPDNVTIAAIKLKTDLIPGTIDGKTFAEIVTLVAAVILGKASGLNTTTAIFRAINDSKTRVTATINANGRSAVTLDAT